MDVYVVVATKGRPRETAILLDFLRRQTWPPDRTVVVGSTAEDVTELDGHPLVIAGAAEIIVAGRAGSSLQRNIGLEAILERTDDSSDFFVAYFDDDFRPAAEWLEYARQTFLGDANIVGLTGNVLADGIRGPGLTENEADDYLKGRISPQSHWASGTEVRVTTAVYGCNMAFRAVVCRSCRFDEALPFYSWQEDRDYTGQAGRLGRVVYAPGCRGVHLGTKSGRTKGVRMGYSQIANPIYLVRKGTMDWRVACRFIFKNVLSNHVKALRPEPWVDRRGRMAGNWSALIDFVRGRLRPSRIQDLD